MKRIFLLAMVVALAGSAFAFDVKTDAKQDYPTFKISGWLKLNYADTLYHDTLVAYPSGFEVRDAYITISGDVWSNLAYSIRLQGNKSTKAGTNTVYAAWLTDAYADWKPSKLYSFRAGQYKRPFGFEQLMPVTNLDFISTSQITGKFNASNRDMGIMGFGVWRDLNYSLSLSNGAPYNEKDANSSKTVVSRVVYAPLAGMTVGGSVEYGTQNTAGKSYYNRHAGLEANYERGKLFARGEFMIGNDDIALIDSFFTKTLTDTIRCGWQDTTGTWHDTTYTRAGTRKIKTATKGLDYKLIRGGYITVGYVPLQKLRVSVRGDLFREMYSWKVDTIWHSASDIDTVWIKTEARTVNWTLGADYFLNPNTKFSVNYDIKQEDLYYRPKKNNILSAQLQVKF